MVVDYTDTNVLLHIYLTALNTNMYFKYQEHVHTQCVHTDNVMFRDKDKDNKEMADIMTLPSWWTGG